jgi:hypothetical protein
MVHNQLARVLHLLSLNIARCQEVMSRGSEGRDREVRLCRLRLCRTMRWIGSCRSLRDDGRKRVQSCVITGLLGAAQVRCLKSSSRLIDSGLGEVRKVGLSMSLGGLNAFLLLLLDRSRR